MHISLYIHTHIHIYIYIYIYIFLFIHIYRFYLEPREPTAASLSANLDYGMLQL